MVIIRVFSPFKKTIRHFSTKKPVIHSKTKSIQIPKTTLPEFVWKNVNKWSSKTAAMPRHYIRKTNREIDEDQIKKALKACLKNKIPIRETARNYGIKRGTLMSRIRKLKQRGNMEKYVQSSDSGLSDDEEKRMFQNKYTANQVFSATEELELTNYIKKSADLHYGLSYRQIRLLAYDYASNIPACKMPASWQSNRIAGKDWLYGFMKRHADLTLRKPESTSLARSTGFNKERVQEFFTIYTQLLEKFKFTAGQIYNLDESGVTTVLKPVNIVAQRGKKQIGQIASGERGELVTFVGIINALGNSLPPVYVVPRIRKPSEYITGAPASSLILGNKSGWMTKELFIEVIEHLKTQTNCSQEKPILLLYDNHESHVSYECIRLCKEAGISLLSFPPHTTHRMQPLDVSVFGPFKTALATAFDDWLLSHPGETITIRNLGELTNKAYTNSFTMSNILSGFKKPGIWPVNRLVFSDTDFAPSSVTDMPFADGVNIIENQQKENTNSNAKVDNQPATVELVKIDKPTLEVLRPYPKKTLHKHKRARKRESKSKIYTSTPVLQEIIKVEEEKKRKLSLKMSNVTKRKIFVNNEARQETHKKHKAEKKTYKKRKGEESSSESDVEISLKDSSSSYAESFESVDILDSVNSQNMGVNDFVIVKYEEDYYPGQILEISPTEAKVSVMVKSGMNHYKWPAKPDILWYKWCDVVEHIEAPNEANSRGICAIKEMAKYSTYYFS